MEQSAIRILEVFSVLRIPSVYDAQFMCRNISADLTTHCKCCTFLLLFGPQEENIPPVRPSLRFKFPVQRTETCLCSIVSLFAGCLNVAPNVSVGVARLLAGYTTEEDTLKPDLYRSLARY